ncbi:MAG: lipoyl(octanoyl) transferase LipB [Candidatus Thermoplasmatota archaeon]|nr:lipoyl(octanoyl) transferase LipB [Candidatus Thermoplasmatota archaeon]
MRGVIVKDIGVISHEEADELMRDLQAKRITDSIDDTLLICEHTEIVTIGPRAKNDGIKPPADYNTRYVDRGGGLTWHGPGQVVFYPVFKWDMDNESNVKAIINMIEEIVIRTFKDMDIEARRDERMQGVWIGEHKVCSIGLSFLRWTSRHGFTINYDTPPGRVEMVSGCGLGSQTTTSLSALGIKVSKDNLVKGIIHNLNFISRQHLD